MPKITKRYMKDRKRENPKLNPVKDGEEFCNDMDAIDETVRKIRAARRAK